MVNVMLDRFVLLLVIVSIIVFVPGSGGADVGTDDDDWDFELEGPIFVFCTVWMCGSLLLTSYNSSRLEADDPSRGGGAAGLVVGTFTTLGGAMAFIYPHPATRVIGAASMAAGGYTLYSSVKGLKAVQRKYIEAEEQGLTFEPILIDDGSGRLGPGLQVSWKF